MNRAHILVAVSGGIAAYKACDLVSKLSRIYDVKVMMTPNAMSFVQPITFAALSHNEVFHEEFGSSDPIPHIELAKWADVLIAAPASANLIAKAVCGIADNLVTSAFLACTCPKIMCPAMNEHMLENPVTQHNLDLARQYGWIVLDPEAGHLACMDSGKGRLPQTDTMLEAIAHVLETMNRQRDAAGFLLPARPTESADPCEASKRPGGLQKAGKDLPKEPGSSQFAALNTQKQKENEPAKENCENQHPKEKENKYKDAGVHSSADFSGTAAGLPVWRHMDSQQNIPADDESALFETAAKASILHPSSLGSRLFAMDTPAGGEDEDEALYDDALKEVQPLRGKHVLVSAGPTQESLDPVRFITNHSSGKQGYAIAEDARDWGAQVILVSGPVSLPAPKDVQMVEVKSAVEMEQAMQKYAGWADFIIMAAAVADYRPKDTADHKIKKSEGSMLVEFVRNPDILQSIGQNKKPHQVLCGFAMETENLDANARAKLESKHCDLLIANNLSTKGAGFQGDTNVVSLLKPDSIEHLPLQSKKELGYTILAQMLEISKGKQL